MCLWWDFRTKGMLPVQLTVKIEAFAHAQAKAGVMFFVFFSDLFPTCLQEGAAGEAAQAGSSQAAQAQVRIASRSPFL